MVLTNAHYETYNSIHNYENVYDNSDNQPGLRYVISFAYHFVNLLMYMYLWCVWKCVICLIQILPTYEPASTKPMMEYPFN